MAEPETRPAKRQLRRDDLGNLTDVASGEIVTIESLSASVLDGERFSVTAANGRDVTLSVLRDVATTMAGVAPAATRHTGGTVGEMLRSMAGAAASVNRFGRVGENGE